MKAWLKVIWLGLFGKVLAKIAAPIAVLFVDRQEHSIWGIRDATDLGYWNCAFRNSAHNMFTRPMPAYTSKGNTKDDTLENLDGFQWRLRKSQDGEYVSFRMTWGKIKPKGKNEFYVGWVMNEVSDYMRLSFFQLRPAWIILTPIVPLLLWKLL